MPKEYNICNEIASVVYEARDEGVLSTLEADKIVIVCHNSPEYPYEDK